jgi:hypothetical protein
MNISKIGGRRVYVVLSVSLTGHHINVYDAFYNVSDAKQYVVDEMGDSKTIRIIEVGLF